MSTFNRSRFVRRLARDGETGEIVRIPEGDEASQALAFALAQTCSAEFLEALLHHKAALDEFGGSVFIAAARERFDFEGNAVEHNEPGSYLTTGYVLNFNKGSRLPGTPDELDSDLAVAEPEPIAQNGASEAATVEMSAAQPEG